VKHVIEQIEQRKRRIAGHPFYRWMGSARAPLGRRFDFAPVLVNFIMAFSDMNKWFMRYPAPSNDFERAINKHTREDETHSRLFLEDWRKLGLDRRLGWSAGDTLAWYHAAPETEIFREHGMDILGMLTRNEDSLVRFALMESIEAWGHVMFSATADVASDLTRVSGTEYRYFGPYHLKRELGHLLAGGHLFEDATLDEGRRARALGLTHRFFDIAEAESDRLLRYAERVIDGGEPTPGARLADAPRRRTGGGSEAPRRGGDDRVAPSQARVARVLDERRRRAADHPLFAWMRAGDGVDAATKLRHIALFWAPDCLGYRDLNAHALAYPRPAGPAERAINRWVADLESHHRLFLRDWAALGMDERLGFSASDTLDFYCRSRHSEVQRRSMSSFVKLAFRHPDPTSRFWLLEALEASGEAFFASTRDLALHAEATHGVRLDYLGDRHAAAHPAREPDPEADAVAFKASALDPAGEDIAVATIHTVFDGLEQQLSMSFDQATSGAFFSH
jgi:hypothetical protein